MSVSKELLLNEHELAYVTVNVVFKVEIIGPQYCIDPRGKDLQQSTKTKESDAKIPVLAYKTG